MEILKILVQAFQGLSAILLIILVLMHSPKAEGLGAIGGTAHFFASQKGAEATLNKITTVVAIAFYIFSFALGHYGKFF